jgi:outer membrane immunogenic protein
MRKLLPASVALMALAVAPVFAAPARAPATPALYSWTAFYVGGNIGWSFGQASTDWTITGVPFGSTSQKMDGILGGLQAGANWQSGIWVLGLETDIQATGQKGSSSVTDVIAGIPGIPCVIIPNTVPFCAPGTGIPPVPPVTSATTDDVKLPWLGTARARLGVTPSDRWLVYATGGLAYGEVQSNVTLMTGGTALGATANSIRLGWTAGGGIEAALWEQWTAKLEYLYVDLGTVNNSFAGMAPFAPITTSTHVTDNIVRVGINRHFGSPGLARP